ncbi:MAG: septal ring lytic transglycosylase RlpA family protein [Hyphomicrobium sp.]
MFAAGTAALCAVALSGLITGLATGSARADAIFAYLDAAAPIPAPRGAAPIGSWTTTVIATTNTAEPVWATTTASIAPREMSTGALIRSQLIRPAAGPRLTGTGHSLSGVASYYWQDQMTATGERFNKRDMTAAHKTLPFGTRVRVTRVDTGANVVVRINDRGPFKPGRIIDLSERAAENLGMTGVGLSPVKLEVLGQ